LGARGGEERFNTNGHTTTLLRFENPAYTTYDASIGAARDAWWTEVYAQNLTNVLASSFTSTSQFALQQTTLRPRVIGRRRVRYGTESAAQGSASRQLRDLPPLPATGWALDMGRFDEAGSRRNLEQFLNSRNVAAVTVDVRGRRMARAGA
jgi:hypothetical protein